MQNQALLIKIPEQVFFKTKRGSRESGTVIENIGVYGMGCVKCGANLASGADKCTECGFSQGETESPTNIPSTEKTTPLLIICETCDGKLAKTADTCPHCGAPNKWVEPILKDIYSALTSGMVKFKAETQLRLNSNEIRGCDDNEGSFSISSSGAIINLEYNNDKRFVPLKEYLESIKNFTVNTRLVENKNSGESGSDWLTRIPEIIIITFAVISFISYYIDIDELLFSKSIKYAENLIIGKLNSPSSYKRVKAKELWNGKDKESNTAYIVKVEYDAQNGFGSMLRDCRIVSFSVKGDKLIYSPSSGFWNCGPANDSEMVSILIKNNEFYQK